MPIPVVMHTEEAQQKLDDLAKSVDWTMECLHSDMLQQDWCKRCNGTGRILRYPHLFEAVWTLSGTVYKGLWPEGYVVRPVTEFLWLALTNGTLPEVGLSLQLGFLRGEHPVLALIEALGQRAEGVR